MSNIERGYNPERIAEQKLNDAYNTLNALFDWLQSDSKFGRTEEKEADFRQMAQENVIKFFDAYHVLSDARDSEHEAWAEVIRKRAEALNLSVPEMDVEDEMEEEMAA